jgi:hypothetical protein
VVLLVCGSVFDVASNMLSGLLSWLPTSASPLQ